MQRLCSILNQDFGLNTMKVIKNISNDVYNCTQFSDLKPEGYVLVTDEFAERITADFPEGFEVLGTPKSDMVMFEVINPAIISESTPTIEKESADEADEKEEDEDGDDIKEKKPRKKRA